MCLEAFDKALNFNLNNYINKNKNTFSYKDINNLMSKNNFLKFFVENIGIYKKEKCIGKGYTGRVNIIFNI